MFQKRKIIKFFFFFKKKKDNNGLEMIFCFQFFKTFENRKRAQNRSGGKVAFGVQVVDEGDPFQLGVVDGG